MQPRRGLRLQGGGRIKCGDGRGGCLHKVFLIFVVGSVYAVLYRI